MKSLKLKTQNSKLKTYHILHSRRGVTLIELLIAIAVTGIIIVSLSQVLDMALSNYSAAQESQGLIPQGRQALERMAMFVQETDQIVTPATESPVEVLSVSERVSDSYNNTTHIYTASGDSIPDADNDSNGRINEGGVGDPSDMITFDLDKTIAGNWRLMEQMPDYSTVSFTDFVAKKVICEYVQSFSCKRLAGGTVEITLALRKGNTAVTLKTSARARRLE